jgi:hypothetical protein
MPITSTVPSMPVMTKFDWLHPLAHQKVTRVTVPSSALRTTLITTRLSYSR